MTPFAVTLAILATIISQSHEAKILAVLPYRGYSHFAVFEPLLLELAKRGHEVQVLCPHTKPEDAPSTYKILPIAAYPVVSSDGSVDPDDIHRRSYSFKGAMIQGVVTQEMCDKGLLDPGVKRLLKTKGEFDLIFVETWSTDCFIGFAHRFKAPVIGLSSSVLMPWADEQMGNPPSLAYAPNLFLGKSDEMDLFDRVRNTVEYVYHLAYFRYYEERRQSLVKQVFGSDTPSTFQLAENTSLVFVNTHESIHPAKPLVPSIINVGGMHLPTPKPLNKDLQSYLDDSPEGIVYFNTGSLLRAEALPRQKVDALFKAFSRLKQRVLWKWVGPLPENAPPNIRFMSWIPQFDLLQHPKVRIFMSHGGLLGSIEATYSAVPLVVIPVFGDQPVNAAALVSRGGARKLPYSDLVDADKILEAITDVMENKKYAEAAKRNSAAFRDRPVPPLDLAIFWSEYVIRHKGASHFRPQSANMPYYQQILLDVILVLMSPILVIFWAVKRCCRRSGSCSEKKKKRD